jgi:soluble lytic murein transglycosylase-like protein
MTRISTWLQRFTLPLPDGHGSVRASAILLVLAAAQSPAQSISERQMESAKQMAEAANRQRAAAQIQTTANEADSFFTTGWSGPAMLPPPLPNCPPMADSETEPLIRAAAARSGLNPVLIKAVIRQESGFKPCVISEKGAMGLMQVMPETAQALGTKDPFDPAENIDAGTRYLKQMLTRFKGDIRLALAAYNAGPEKVDGPKPAVPDIAETRDYVEAITAALHDEPAELPQNDTSKNR